MLQLILFDLDGTLVDTAPDLGLALNMQRERHGLPPLPMETIRPFASHGSRGLLSVGFGLTPDHTEFAPMREEYLDLYDKVFTRSPILFPGIAELLSTLESRNLRWGVVTNKPGRFTLPLLQAIGLDKRACCVVSGDDAPRPKPHPDTLLLALHQARVQPQHCLYVGDAERDIQAARAAGINSVVALFGYLDESDRPEEWGADAAVNTPLEVLNLI
ncbi:MAG TPA: HAD-IA family hydrolase [Methylophilaceae bacterium]|nr:HAD-IA family hydrolase [Methylophilaceae bacterium]